MFERPDGSIDRRALARIVFDDPAALRDLEAIVHPAVRPRILAGIAAADDGACTGSRRGGDQAVEWGLARLCDEVWLVTCDAPIQRGRLRARGSQRPTPTGASPPSTSSRPRRTGATRGIDTSGTLDETRAEVARAWAALRT